MSASVGKLTILFSLPHSLRALVLQGKVVQNQPFDEAVELSSSEYVPASRKNCYIPDSIPSRMLDTKNVHAFTDPLEPLTATLRYVAHEAVERPDGHSAYRVRATLDAGQQPRVGLKGTARLEGESVALGYWILRRPLAALRAWAGL